MKAYKYIVLILSFAVIGAFIKEYLLLFILLSELALIIGNRPSTPRKNLIVIYILLLIVLFIALRGQYWDNYILPMGYSVFSFSVISYLVDLKISHEKIRRVDLYCYLLFFPKFFAGPIIRSNSFNVQIKSKFRLKKNDIYNSFKLIIFASFCKFTVADYLYTINIDDCLGVNKALAIITYGIAFYMDFWAYSLFAIAISRLMGVKLPKNFDAPYISKSYKDFWRKWNITLSTWLRDYVYIPLGGSRKGYLSKYMNIIIAFILSSLWHGSTLTFFLWGIIHAFFVIFENICKFKPNIVTSIFVFVTSCLLWQLFRVDSINEFYTVINQCFMYEELSWNIVITTILSITVLLSLDSKSIKALVFTEDNYNSFIIKEVTLLTILLTITLLLPRCMNFNFFYLRF